MSRLENELRREFERRVASIPARPDLRAQVSDTVARHRSGVRVWQVTAATAGLLLLGTITFFGLVSRNSQVTPFVRPWAGVPSAVPSMSPTSAPSATPSPCPPPANYCATTTAIGNFDDSGPSEVFSASAIRDESGGSAYWLLQVTAPNGHIVSARLDSLLAAHDGCPTEVPDYAMVKGAAKFAGPPHDLALVDIRRGASTESGILVGIQNGNLQVAMVTNGANRCQRIFPRSGSVTHGNGLACGTVRSGPVLLVRQVEDHPPDYAHYDWYQATYEWQGLQLSLLSLDHAVITQNDSRFQPSYSVTCGSLRIPT